MCCGALRSATVRYGVLRATRLQAGGVDRAFISRLLGYGIGNKAYLRGERGPDRDTTLVVACEAAWPGCGRLLLPGPLHLLRATRRPAPLHAYPGLPPSPSCSTSLAYHRSRPGNPAPHPLTNITDLSLCSVLTHLSEVHIKVYLPIWKWYNISWMIFLHLRGDLINSTTFFTLLTCYRHNRVHL